nr:hypothetical protein BaRGS_012248 [Batillaria attramentaria]
MEIPKTLMQEDAAGDASSVTQYVVVAQSNGQTATSAAAGETVVLVQMDGGAGSQDGEGQVVAMEETVAMETKEGEGESDGEGEGLLQPGEALTGADDEGETRIINLDEDDEEEEEEAGKDGGDDKEAEEEADEEEEEEEEDDTGKTRGVKAAADDVMQLPAQAMQDQTLTPAHESEDPPSDSQGQSPTKRTIRSPEKLAAARKAAATAFGFDDPEPAEPADQEESTSSTRKRGRGGRTEKDTETSEKEKPDQAEKTAPAAEKRRGRPSKDKPQEEEPQAESDAEKKAQGRRGRRSEAPAQETEQEKEKEAEVEETPRRRGRPPKRYMDEEPEPKEKEEKKTPAASGRGRGRPRKEADTEAEVPEKSGKTAEATPQESTRGRGRASKKDETPAAEDSAPSTPRRGRGRPRKEEAAEARNDDLEEAEESMEEEGEEETPEAEEEGKRRRSGRQPVKKVVSEETTKGSPRVTKKAVSQETEVEESNKASPRATRKAVTSQDTDKAKGKGSKDDEPATPARRGRARSRRDDDEEQAEQEQAETEKEVETESQSRRPSRKRTREEEAPAAPQQTTTATSPATPSRKKPRSQAEIQILPAGMTRVKEEPVEEEPEDPVPQHPVPGTPAAPTVHVIASQSVTLLGGATSTPVGPHDTYSFEELETTTDMSHIEESSLDESGMVSTGVGTQTPQEPEFVEVQTIYESPNRRSVQTQTDPRLKKKKFGPLNVDAEVDTMDFDDDDDDYDDETGRRRRRRDDDISLFEDSEPRRKSIKRNTEEALKCPFCEKAFIGLVKHIKSKHSEEADYEEEMRNAKWRERIMKVSTTGSEEMGDTCTECGKVTKNMKRHMELHQQNRMQIPCPICSKVVLKTGMSSHMRTVHSGRKPYKCPHCDYSSAFRGNLNTHIKVNIQLQFGMHLHTRQYLCNTCKAAFKTLGALIGHTKRVHEGWKSPNQKIFICSVCEKRFTRSTTWTVTCSSTPGKSPQVYGLRPCFNNKSNLMSHIQLVHKKLSPYMCDMCHETFKRKKLLLEHIGKIHVAHGEAAKAMQAYIRKIEEEAPEDESMETAEDEEGAQTITITQDEDGQTFTTLQTEGGQETIIIVQAADPNEVTHAIVEGEEGAVQFAMQAGEEEPSTSATIFTTQMQT